MIPLSMYVSMEMVRVTNATQTTGANGVPGAATRTTSIMEELGQVISLLHALRFITFIYSYQVQYLFADKTGTLTWYVPQFLNG